MQCNSYEWLIETVSAFSPAINPGILTKTPSGAGDMEIQKAVLFYYVMTSNVCLHHIKDFSLWFNPG